MPYPERGDPDGDRDVLRRAAHDLKNPLAVVRATIEWLEAEGLASSADARDALRDAEGAIAQLTRIVDDISALAHLPAGAAPSAFERARVDVALLADEALAACAERVRTSRAAVTREVPAGLSLLGDAALLGRCLTILVDTVLRGTPRGAPVAVTAERGKGTVRLAVVATSPDIDPAADLLGATSLAMHFAARIVEVHGGVMTASASSIVVELPA